MRRRLAAGGLAAWGFPLLSFFIFDFFTTSFLNPDFFFFFTGRDAVVGSRRRRERGCGSGE